MAHATSSLASVKPVWYDIIMFMNNVCRLCIFGEMLRMRAYDKTCRQDTVFVKYCFYISLRISAPC